MSSRIFNHLAILSFAVASGAYLARASESELCSVHMPRLTGDADSALLALEPWKPIPIAGEEGKGARSPASSKKADSGRSGIEEKVSFEYPVLPEADRKAWMKWADERLARSQETFDQVKRDPTLRHARNEVSRVAVQIVEFHGYARNGNVSRMSQALKRLRTYSEAAQAKICK